MHKKLGQRLLALIAVMGGIFLANYAHAATADCGEIVDEMEAMRKAQNTLLTSLASNHETFAVTVEDLRTDLELHSKNVPPRALKAMGRTAQAFRVRGVQGRKSAEKLNEATADLISRLETCLKK